VDQALIAVPLPLDGRADSGSFLPLPAFRPLRQRRVPQGSVLVPEGRRPDTVLVVVSGALMLAVTGNDGRRAVVGLLGPGDIYGEQGIWRARSSRIAPEIRAASPSTVITLSPHELHRAMSRDPSIAVWLIQALSRMGQDLQARLAETLGLGARDRSLEILRALAERWGHHSPNGRVLDLTLSQEALASMAGVSRECMNRALRELRADGLVLKSGRRYVLPEPRPTRTDRSTTGPGPPTPPPPT
jgi:CRP/FNR family cyclic AMP-dependent transcriptional regulator